MKPLDIKRIARIVAQTGTYERDWLHPTIDFCEAVHNALNEVYDIDGRVISALKSGNY